MELESQASHIIKVATKARSFWQAMETVLHQLALLAPPATTRASTWMNISAIPIHLHILPSNKRAKQLQAQGKGFGITVSDKKARPEEDDNIYRTDDNTQSDGDDEMPPEVFDRMIRRMLFSVGIPMASGIGLLYVLSWLKKGNVWEVPGWLPFLTILLSFGTSAMGIAYASLTTSWDPKKEGSLLGWEEAQKNWPELWRDDDEKI